MLQLRQAALEAFGHRGVVEAAEHRRHDEHLGFGEAQHELELTLAEDRHQRVDDRTDAPAGERRDDELPPVRHLQRHDVTRPDAERAQPAGGQRDLVGELAVRQARGLRPIGSVGHQRRLVGCAPNGFDEELVDRPVEPEARCAHRAGVGGGVEGLGRHAGISAVGGHTAI